jgi:hypothetical protein
MARFEQVSFSEHDSGAPPQRLPLPTCILTIASISLTLWLMLGWAVRLSL